MLLNSRTGKNAKQYVERKLVRRLWRFFAIFVVLVSIIIYEVSQDYIEGAACVGAMMLGMLVGAVFVRRKRVYWEEETSTIIARMDRVGIAMLVIYVLFAISRHVLLHNWLHGRQLTAFSLSLTAGAMLGRLLSIRSQIRQILKERKII